jgi:hypothetical protein
LVALPSRVPKEQTRNRTIALAVLLTTACVVSLLLSNTPTAMRSDPLKAELAESLHPEPSIVSDPPPSPLYGTITDSARATLPPESPAVDWSELGELNLEWLLPNLELPRERRSEWLSRVRQVGGSLRPLTNSVTSTFSILRRTWPGTHASEPNGTDQVHLPSESDQLS